ncbi:4-hydroxy-tetrahydrodipicolinate reductase [Candidatus Lokiarchaeum ossiferum]|uniref:4-hydroxy-tetrahydrodipicolinate reductase n=1 Tax=Candidatus Lokiarchaeum ossiferum TaxID=2951803 RepID=UPI00352BDFE8
MTQLKVAIFGGDGRMGLLISNQIINDPQFQLVGSFAASSSVNLNVDIGFLIGKGKIGVILQDAAVVDAWLHEHPVDIIIDFSSPEATIKNCSMALNRGIPCVIGTTGISAQNIDRLKSLSEHQLCSCVIASNMLRGVNVFFHVAELIASYTKSWDVEILETHHRNKVDSPSGTALTLGNKIAEKIDAEFNSAAIYGREGKTLRKSSNAEIGFHSIRAGDIIGEHTVLFAGAGERIELTHRAHNREGYAKGSLVAATFLNAHRSEGVIFSMDDILGLKQI